MPIILPFHPETASATIEIDGVTYRVPIVDSDGHLQVDVLSNALPTGAATSAKQDTMITALQLIDDLRAVLDAVRTDRLNVNVYRDGASEVKTARLISAGNSTTRATIATPTSGKKIRIISVVCSTGSATVTVFEFYFGTGAAITTNPGNEITEYVLDVDVQQSIAEKWPDGGGPVGAVDEVVSFRTVSDIVANARMVIAYREE